MRIRLRTNFSYRSLEGEEFRLPPSVSTVSDLLRHIEKERKSVFLDALTEEPRPDIEIILNGKEIWFYPGGLQRSLNDGDTLEIMWIPLGGG